MTSTSEERREVAARLRGPFDVCGCGRYTYLNGTLYGMQVCAKDELTLRDGMRRLADLLDPTCKNKYRNHNDRSFLCSKCGYEALTYGDSFCDPDEFGFCPNCGARVVSGDGE